MARNFVCHARYGLNPEDSLRLCAKRNSCLEWIIDAMAAKKLEQICRVLIDDDVGVRNVNAKAIRQGFFTILYTMLEKRLEKRCIRGMTLPSNVFSNRDMFLSEASANGISITSAICLPSPSMNRALKEPASDEFPKFTSC
jgi:hypothetical protein